MPSTLIRLAVALLAFGLGVSATMFWIAYRTPEVNDKRVMKLIKVNPRLAHPLPPSPPLATIEELPPPPPPLPRTPQRIVQDPLFGDSINDKVLSKPAPVYPSVAVISNVSGMVNVEVFVDERGRVESAEAVHGHPLLRQAAVDAAYGARFSPTLRQGQPVKVMGVISYNFELP
ncbi:MAG: periplasmic protein TonB [Pyrinomonadaceae bacterium]|jgi:TonB family protein|nr:periplasmic protein TonB [Pyrinomonadaceae bacterium]